MGTLTSQDRERQTYQRREAAGRRIAQRYNLPVMPLTLADLAEIAKNHPELGRMSSQALEEEYLSNFRLA
jgi:hypothetical protein